MGFTTSFMILLMGIVAVILVLAVIVYYNRLTKLTNAYQNALKQIDVQLKRRHDLIPNLVETVENYVLQERKTLKEVIEQRNQAEQARQAMEQVSPDQGGAALHQALSELGGAEQALSSLLRQLFALSEDYPDLQANENFRDLQEELAHTENRIAYARQLYNDAIERYNNACTLVPSNFVAMLFGFRSGAYLDFENQQTLEQVPSVSMTA